MIRYSKEEHLATRKARAEHLAERGGVTVWYDLEPQGWSLPQAFRFGYHVLDEIEERWLRICSRCVEIEPGTWAAMVSVDTDETLAEARFDGEFLWRVSTPADPQLRGGAA